jgi:membrane protein YqaA with SNARE-associated domain
MVGDSVSVKRWLLGYLAGLVIALSVLAWLMGRFDWRSDYWLAEGLSISQKWSRFLEVFAGASAAIKLLGFAIYISLCTTFLPLPTGGMVAALATRQASLAGGLDAPTIVIAAITTGAVALVGAAASTVANLNDYYLLTWMLRNRRVAGVRNTRTYQAAAQWFARSPKFLLVVFNIIPIPVDVVRILATTYRFPRIPFAAANFAGRFIRYAVIAFVTYWWNLGWIAVVSLLAVAVVLGLSKLAAKLVSRFKTANDASDEVSIE